MVKKMKEHIIQKVCFEFALIITNTYSYRLEQQNEFILKKQLSRAGSCIDANKEKSCNICASILQISRSYSS